jgi:hypothetical protein
MMMMMKDIVLVRGTSIERDRGNYVCNSIASVIEWSDRVYLSDYTGKGLQIARPMSYGWWIAEGAAKGLRCLEVI